MLRKEYRVEGQAQPDELGVDLLGEHVAAKGNAPLQSDGSKVGTVSSLGLGPSFHGRNKSSDSGSQKAQHAEISADGLDALAILRPFGTQMQELHHAIKVLAGSGSLYAGDVLHLRGKWLLGRHRYQRAAVEHKELQEDHDRHYKNQGCHHRGTAARREGASLASSFTNRNEYVHAAGKIQPSMGVT